METDWEPGQVRTAGPRASGGGGEEGHEKWGLRETECWGLGVQGGLEEPISALLPPQA